MVISTEVEGMPSAMLMDQLSAMRLSPPGARANTGIGERASRARGPGMEFADFRAYRAGDDLRHVDPRSLIRGEPFTREYMQRRQLTVTIVLDLTLSMTVGDRAKAKLALGLARALGFVALAGQDRLKLIVLEGDGSSRHSPVWQGRSKAQDMFSFASPQSKYTAGSADGGYRNPGARHAEALVDSLAHTLDALVPGLDAGSVILVVSDFWGADVAQALAALGNTPAMVLALQILGSAERDPSLLGSGIVRLADAETGEERDMALDEEMLGRYRAALGQYQDELGYALEGGRHLFLPLSAEEQLSTICMERLPALGVIA